jgi:hypothetical protein
MIFRCESGGSGFAATTLPNAAHEKGAPPSSTFSQLGDNDATRDPTLLRMLKSSSKAPNQPKTTAVLLRQVVDAAESVDTAGICKEALALIEELKRKGPTYRRDISWWGYLGQSEVAGGCIAASVAGQVELGLPCVVGDV